MSNNATIAMTFGSLSMAAVGHAGYAQHATVATSLPGAVLCVNARKQRSGSTGTLYRLSGPPTAKGGAIYEFIGVANRAITWSLITGTGVITALSTNTDETGRAYAVFESGGYTGPIKIGVTYGG